MENDTAPMRHDGDENRQVSVWTPEDASRFLSSAIQEAQRPLTDALRQRAVSPGIFALVIVLLAACAAACGWVLIGRLEKAEQATDSARLDRDLAIGQRHEMQSRHDTVSARLSASQEQAERIKRELEMENDRLRTEAAGYKSSDEDLKRLRTDLNRYRRQTELLRTQISGLELEKQALARQLHAVKALAGADEEEVAPAFGGSDPAENIGDLYPPAPPAGGSAAATPPPMPPPETAQPAADAQPGTTEAEPGATDGGEAPPAPVSLGGAAPSRAGGGA